MFIWHPGCHISVLSTFNLGKVFTWTGLPLSLTLKDQQDFHFHLTNFSPLFPLNRHQLIGLQWNHINSLNFVFIKIFYRIIFSTGIVGSNEKLFPPFPVCSKFWSLEVMVQTFFTPWLFIKWIPIKRSWCLHLLFYFHAVSRSWDNNGGWGLTPSLYTYYSRKNVCFE